jgi:hypothetical protein
MYLLGFYIPEDAIRHSHRRENLKSYLSFMNLSLPSTFPTPLTVTEEEHPTLQAAIPVFIQFTQNLPEL